MTFSRNPVDFTLLHGTQKFGLQPRVHFADFVEQQGAAIGFFEFPHPSGNGARKSAFLMTEKFGFQQVLGDRCAVDRNELFLGPFALLMHVARQQFLTCPAFTCDQDTGIAACDLVGELEQVLHRRIAEHDRVGFLGHGFQNRRDHIRVRRQRNIFLRPGIDRAHGGGGIVADSTADHRDTDAFKGQAVDQVLDIELDVRHHQIGALSGPQRHERAFDIVYMGNRGAACHGDLAGRPDLTV